MELFLCSLIHDLLLFQHEQQILLQLGKLYLRFDNLHFLKWSNILLHVCDEDEEWSSAAWWNCCVWNFRSCHFGLRILFQFTIEEFIAEFEIEYLTVDTWISICKSLVKVLKEKKTVSDRFHQKWIEIDLTNNQSKEFLTTLKKNSNSFDLKHTRFVP